MISISTILNPSMPSSNLSKERNSSMTSILCAAQRRRQEEFRCFVGEHVEPYADAWDRAGEIPADVIRRIGDRGWVGGLVPADHGGLGWDHTTFGLLNEAFGRGSSSLTVLFTV